jgi:hypothetical protein
MPRHNRNRDHRADRPQLPVTRTEPALTRGAVVSALGALASLGVWGFADLSAKQIGTIATVAVVVVPLVQAWWTRYGVVAVDKVLLRLSSSRGVVVAGKGAAAPTGTVIPLELHAGGSLVVPPLTVARDLPVDRAAIP